MVGSVPHYAWGFTCFSWLSGRLEFHCALYLQDRSRNANGIASGAGGGVADGFLTEVSKEMRFE